MRIERKKDRVKVYDHEDALIIVLFGRNWTDDQVRQVVRAMDLSFRQGVVVGEKEVLNKEKEKDR